MMIYLNIHHFTTKADNLALAIGSIDEKVKYIDAQIKDLQSYKKTLKESVTIAKEITASVFVSMGISKLEGSLVSSLTVTAGTRSSKLEISFVQDEAALIEAGYYTKILDEKRIISEYMTGDAEQIEQLKEHCIFELVTKDTPAKLRINKRKAANNTNPPSIDITNIDDAA